MFSLFLGKGVVLWLKKVLIKTKYQALFAGAMPKLIQVFRIITLLTSNHQLNLWHHLFGNTTNIPLIVRGHFEEIYNHTNIYIYISSLPFLILHPIQISGFKSEIFK
jgi:hypothetical protein